MKYVDYYPSGLSYKTNMVVRYSTTVWCSSQSVPRVNAEGKKLPTSEWLHHISIVVCSWWELCTAAYTAFLCSCIVSWELLSGLSLLSVGYPQHFSIHMTVLCIIIIISKVNTYVNNYLQCMLEMILAVLSLLMRTLHSNICSILLKLHNILGTTFWCVNIFILGTSPSLLRYSVSRVYNAMVIMSLALQSWRWMFKYPDKGSQVPFSSN